MIIFRKRPEENMLLLELEFYAFKSNIKHFKCMPYDGYCSGNLF